MKLCDPSLPGRLSNLPGICRGEVLPIEFETELDASSGISRCDRAEISVSQVRVGLEEVGMVQRIKHLEAELQSLGLAKVPPLVDAHVPHEVLGCAKIREESR